MKYRNQTWIWIGRSTVMTTLLLSGFFVVVAYAEEKEDAVFKKQEIEAATTEVTKLEKDVQQITAFYEKGRFAGWPATHGVWNWGNEILTGFSLGYHKDLGTERHNIDREKPETHHLLRSLDGGVTWRVENPNERGVLVPQGQSLHGKPHPDYKEKEWTECPGGVNFQHPDFCMTIRMTNMHKGPSRFYYSYDRGHEWFGPFKFPDVGTPGIAARTNYIVEGPGECLVFLTAAKASGQEGRPCCVRTTDGAKTWEFVGWIAEEQPGYAIMPSSIRLGEKEFLSVIRYRDPRGSWLDSYRSLDRGKSWSFNGKPVEDTGEGSPPSLIQLKDGRLCLSYGVRRSPSRICAKLSEDGGVNWSREYVLRNDGAGRDIGYPVSVQRPDGKVVVIYYFHAKPNPERFIGATIWQPPPR